MIKHALCQRENKMLASSGIFWCNFQSTCGAFAVVNNTSRFVFADAKHGATGSEDEEHKEKEEEKKEKVTVTQANAREVIKNLSSEKKIDTAAEGKALKILEKGSEEEKKNLLPHLQRAVDGALNVSEFNKFLSEAEKKIPAKTEGEKESSKKPKDDEEELTFDVKSKIKLQTEEAVAETGKAASALMNQGEEKQEAALKIKNINQELKNLNAGINKYGDQINNSLKEMVDNKQITPALANELAKIDFNETDAQKKWEQLTKDISDPKAKTTLESLTKLKEKNAESDVKILQEYDKKLAEFRELMNKEGEKIHEILDKKRNLEALSGSAGFPLNVGQTLVYKRVAENPETKLLEETQQKVKIKDIVYDDMEIKDDKGNITKKIKSVTPAIIIESLDQEDKVFRQDKMSMADFLDWVDAMDVAEDLQTKKDLEKSIDTTLNEGDQFEYRQLLSAVTRQFSPEDITVKVEKIDQSKQEITLDQEIRLSSTAPKTRRLNYGQFAKWFKRNEVMRPIENLSKLRDALILHNNIQNQVFKRDPSMYPHIEATEGEILKYDNEDETKFVIKEINDKKIVLDNGAKYTPAAFLRWIKKNHVQKFSPEAEAIKSAEMEQGDGEKKKTFEEVKQKAEREQLKILEEADKLPPNLVIQKPEIATHHPTGYIRQLWNDTSIASLYDLWEVGKTSVELIERKLKRWSHGKVGVIGQSMFAGFGGNSVVGSFFTELGAEFKGVAQHAENEEVNHHVEHYRTMGIETVKHELHEAPNKDILKAAITVLSEKGELRWDDHGLWDSMNKFAQGIPCWVEKKSYLENIENIMDAWWGQGTFKEFRTKQDSAYNGTKSSFKDNAKRLENDPLQNGGLRSALKGLLYKHIHGEYVSAAEYESYLDFAIDAGKLSFEEKLYFLVMGIAAESPGAHGHHGQTLLHIDRAGAIEGDRLNQFPIIDYFVKSMQQVDENGNPIYKINEKGEKVAVIEKPNINNFKVWFRNYCLPDLKNKSLDSVESFKDLKPGDTFKTFIREEVLWDDATRIRMDKAAKSPEQWDHDDMHMFVTILGEETIEQITKKAGGAKQQLSNEGIKNAYLGLNHFTKLKMEMMQRHLKDGTPQGKAAAEKDLRDLMNILRSFVRFDSILDRRYYHADNAYTRFGDQEKRGKPGWDSSRPVKTHIEEMHNFLKELGNSVGLNEDVKVLFKQLSASTPDEKAKQQSVISEFGKKLEGALAVKKIEDINNLFQSIQDKNRNKGNKQVRGILDQPETKVEAKEITKASVQLNAYRSEEIQEKIELIKSLQKRLGEVGKKPVEEVAKEGKKRLNEIYREIDEGTYIRQANDLKILDDQINEITAAINAKETEAAKKIAQVNGGVGTAVNQNTENKKTS